ncbi:MAG: CBS domain-containing protein [Bacteroidota bacterium]
MTVRKIINQNGGKIWTINRSASVLDALEKMAFRGIGALPVVDQQKQLVGIFSERDYARKSINLNKNPKDLSIESMMTPKVITVDIKDSLFDCMKIMTDKHIRHLPVQENNSLVGMITMRDVVREIISDQKGTISELTAYIHGSYVGR